MMMMIKKNKQQSREEKGVVIVHTNLQKEWERDLEISREM